MADHRINRLNILIWQHEDQHDQVKRNSELLEPFPITDAVKQRCILERLSSLSSSVWYLVGHERAS